MKGRVIAMDASTPHDLKKAFSGKVILPQDAEYEQARAVFIGKGSPAIVAQARTSEDVALAIRYAQQQRLVLSVRSGGHSNAGLSTNDGGMVVDVSLMNNVAVVDQAKRRVRVGAGAQWGDIAEALYEHGLGISSGDTLSVGASGLVLGGGIGWMVREHGLAIDSLLQAEIVTADGQLLRASQSSHPDLFWAIRGGGGNFGVITSLEFVAHPAGKVFFGPITFAAGNLPALLKGWRDYMRRAPEALTTTITLMPANFMGESPAMIIATCCWDGNDETAAQAALDPLRSLGTVLNDDVTKKPYAQVMEEAHTPAGAHIEVNNAFFQDFSDKIIDSIAAAYAEHKMMFQIRSVGGALNRIPVSDTAFAHRDSEVLVVSPHILPPNTSEEAIQKTLEPWRTIAKHSNGAYINFFSRATEQEVHAAYPPATYKRLAQIKDHYDPHNLFNQNLNIIPSAE